MNAICNAHSTTLQIMAKKPRFIGRSSNGRLVDPRKSLVKRSLALQIVTGFLRLRSIICNAIKAGMSTQQGRPQSPFLNCLAYPTEGGLCTGLQGVVWGVPRQ